MVCIGEFDPHKQLQTKKQGGQYETSKISSSS